VHIADVSHYVEKDNIMDKEAAHRSTSVYLVDRVLPMFPENLSNRVCSLRPNEEKLCFSAVFELDKAANLVQEWFGRTVIYSDKRFDYDQAQAILDSGEGDFAQELSLLNDLAKKMRTTRMQSGAIAFNSEEVKFKLDEKGKPIEVYLKVMKDSNHLIEDFMLLANKRVARLLNIQEPAIPMVNRVHDLPDMEKLTNFKNIASSFGYMLNLNTPKLIAQSLNNLLQQIQGKPEQHLLETLAVRSMAKAAYSTNNKGHYGLGFDNYAHFTSPIRRFPDVMVHRILANYLNKAEKPIYSTEELESNCEHCSMMERKAMVAERESIKYKQVEYLSEHLGEVFEGTISGVSTFGFWVELKDNKCEGMVRLQTMLDDHYIYDERLFCLLGIHSNKKYQLGQTVKVVIVKTDLLMRTIDLELVD
jgi:ribonuclease R